MASRAGMGSMCTDKDCDIFRGKLMACDTCERMSDRTPRGFEIPAHGQPVMPKTPQMP